MDSRLDSSKGSQRSKVETNSDDLGIDQSLPDSRVKREETSSTIESVETKPGKMVKKVISTLQGIEDSNHGIGKFSKREKSVSGPGLCNVCSKMFSNRKTLRVHMKMHDEDIRCGVCSKLFTNVYILKVHVLTHTQKKTESLQCSQSVFNMEGHMKRVHSGLANYVTCSNCGVKVRGIGKHEKICKMTDEEKAA